MGLRFRKSARLLPGVRINFSLSGASLTVGGRGASVNIGRRGTYANLGLPGTGLSYRTRINSPSVPAQQQPLGTATQLPTTAYPSSLRVQYLAGLAVAALAVFAGFELIGLWNVDKQDVVTLTSPEPLLDSARPVAFEAQAPLKAPLTSPVNPPLSTDQIRQLQSALKQLGLDPGPADGIAGGKTISAVKLYRLSTGRPATETIDAALLMEVVMEARKGASP